MKKKVILIICLVLVLAIGLFVLTGCGNKKEENNSTSNSSQSVQNNSSKDNKSSSKKEVTEIAKSSASNYKIEPEKMGIEYEGRQRPHGIGLSGQSHWRLPKCFAGAGP